MSFLALVLGSDESDYRRWSTVTEEDLSLAVNDVLLQIVCNCLRSTEILHSFRHFHAKFLAKKEEGVNC